MTPNMIKQTWQKAALDAGQRGDHDYLPKNEEQLQEFTPHSWVMHALIDFAERIHTLETVLRQAIVSDDIVKSLVNLLASLPDSPRLLPVPVERDENGYWSHPDFPMWDERNTDEEVKWYLGAQGLELYVAMLSDCEGCQAYDAYFNQDSIDVSTWAPTCHKPDSFLLSIYDNEDGPIALFAAPICPKTTEQRP